VSNDFEPQLAFGLVYRPYLIHSGTTSLTPQVDRSTQAKSFERKAARPRKIRSLQPNASVFARNYNNIMLYLYIHIYSVVITASAPTRENYFGEKNKNNETNNGQHGCVYLQNNIVIIKRTTGVWKTTFHYMFDRVTKLSARPRP